MPTNDPLNYGSPSTHVDEHGIEKPQPHASPKFDTEHPGYETTDVNTRGIVVFLGGLLGFVFIFFFLCFGIGKAINMGILKQDGDEAKLKPNAVTAGGQPATQKRLNLADNSYLEQQESARIAQNFPSPRLDVDDGNAPTADLHAREDLLLEHTSVATDGTVRIPIDQAMELIAKRGLAVAPGATQKTLMFGEKEHTIAAPLTNGFARTAYEIEQIESREQKMNLTQEGAGERAPAEKK